MQIQGGERRIESSQLGMHIVKILKPSLSLIMTIAIYGQELLFLAVLP